MKKMHKAAQWAYEAQKTKTSILWNVWVMLAMPAVWLVWSIILFIIGIMSFVWRGTTHAGEGMQISEEEALVIRIGITALLSIGIFYFLAMTRTFSRYGRQMDEDWQRTVRGWSESTSLDDVGEAKEQVEEAWAPPPASLPSDPEFNHLDWMIPEPDPAPKTIVSSAERSVASLSTIIEESPQNSPVQSLKPVGRVKSEDFVNSFWDAGHRGVEALEKRMDDSSATVERLVTFFDERWIPSLCYYRHSLTTCRARIEEGYALQLKRLCGADIANAEKPGSAIFIWSA
jgi:hypothetical protein